MLKRTLQMTSSMLMLLLILTLCMPVTPASAAFADQVEGQHPEKVLENARNYAADQLKAITSQKNFSSMITSKKNEKKLRSLLQKQISASHQCLLDIYWASERGSFVLMPDQPLPEGYNARVRPWYTSVKKSLKPYASTFYDAVDEKYIMAYTIPVLDKNGKLLGVLGTDCRPYLVPANKGIIQPSMPGAGEERVTEKPAATPDALFISQWTQEIKKDAASAELIEAAKTKKVEALENCMKAFASNRDVTVYFAQTSGHLTLSKKVDLAVGYDAREREWYKVAVSGSDKLYTALYRDAFTNQSILTLATAVRDPDLQGKSSDETLLGVLAMDITVPEK